MILRVRFRLPKAWRPELEYLDLQRAAEQAGVKEPTPQQISDWVCAIRRAKGRIAGLAVAVADLEESAARYRALLGREPVTDLPQPPDGAHFLAFELGRAALTLAAPMGEGPSADALRARLDTRDLGSRDTVAGEQLGRGWLPVDYAEGLVRVGVQSAIAHPDTAALLRKLMTDRGLPTPEPLTTSVCLTAICK